MSSPPDPSMKAEERRALVLLALLAVLVGLYDKLPLDAFYNSPANSPFPHLTIFVIPTLANMIYLWVGYGGCMLFYFSDDWFPGKQWCRHFHHKVHVGTGNRQYPDFALFSRKRS